MRSAALSIPEYLMRHNNRIASFFLPAILALLPPSQTGAYAAQEAPTTEQIAISTGVQNFCSRTITKIRTDFSPNLAAYPDIRDKENLVLLEPYLEFNAIARFRNKQITLTTGMCGQLWLIASAFAFAHEFPSLRPKIKEYIKHLRTNSSPLETSSGFHEIQLLTFPLYAQFPLSQVTTEQYKHIDAFVAISMTDAIAFVLAHEIAHLALNHQLTIPRAASRLQEYEADKFALELVEKSGFSGIGSIPSLLAFLESEARQKRVSISSHPRPECRLNRILSRSGTMRAMIRDKKQHAQFLEMTGMTVDAYRQFMDELRDDCIANP